MVVEDEAITALDLTAELQTLGYEVCGCADTPEAAIEMARKEQPDVVLMDIRLGDSDDGIATAEEICRERETAVVFLTAHSDDATLERALSVAPFGYLVKPFRARELKLTIEVALSKQAQVAHRQSQLEEQAVTDPLTGLDNRRRLVELLDAEWGRAKRDGRPIAVVAVDIDHFKSYNDTRGHPAGDACLRAVARVLTGVCARSADRACRMGGEEFLLLLPTTDQAGADHVAAAVVQAVREKRFLHGARGAGEFVTVSAGAASMDPASGGSPDDLIEVADRALYRAKQEGRDRYASAFEAAPMKRPRARQRGGSR